MKFYYNYNILIIIYFYFFYKNMFIKFEYLDFIWKVHI